jgi:serine/threonine protein kinase
MDLFAVGAIMAELYTGVPLFPGSTERDQLVRILQLMGTPTKEEWPEGYRLAAQLGMEMPEFEGAPLGKVVGEAPQEALGLIGNLLQVCPGRRMTAQQALQHEYFRVRGTEKEGEVWGSLEGGGREEEGWIKNARYRPGKKCKL